MTSARLVRGLSRSFEGRSRRPASDYYNLAVLGVLVVAEAIGLLAAPRHGASESLWAAASSLPADRSAEGITSVLLLVAALLVMQIARFLGPIGVSSSQAQWWLPLPVARRGLVAPGYLWSLAAPVLLSSLSTGLVLVSVRGLALGGPTLASAAGAASLSVTTVAAGMLLQRFVKAGKSVDSILSVLVPATMLGLVLSVVVHLPLASASWLPTSWIVVLSDGALWPLTILVPVALVAGALMYVGLPRLSTAQLRRAGSEVSTLAVSALSLGGASFAATPERPSYPRAAHPISVGLARGPHARFVLTQLRVWIRWPGHVSRACFFALLPAVILLPPYFDSVAVLIVVLTLSTLRMASMSGSIAGIMDANPALGRLFLLSQRNEQRLSTVVPLVVLLPWCFASFGLLDALGAAPNNWLLMALPVGVGLSGSAVRTGTRPDPNWASAAISTPMGTVPLGMLLSALHGRTASIVVLLPALVALVDRHVTAFGLVSQAVLGLGVWCWSTVRR